MTKHHDTQPGKTPKPGIESIQNIPYPWEKQPAETSLAFAAFAHYRDLGPDRSLARVASDMASAGKRKNGGRGIAHYATWSTKHRWVDRASAWDAEKDRRKREAVIDEMVKMAQLHARVASTQINALSRPAIELLSRINSDPTLLSKVSTDDLFDMVASASRAIPGMANMERVSRADPQAQQIPTFNGPASKPMSFVDAVEDASAAWRALRDAGVVSDDDAEADE